MFFLLTFSHALPLSFFFFFNDTATTEIYTLSLHDALPISTSCPTRRSAPRGPWAPAPSRRTTPDMPSGTAIPGCSRRRSEEHTSELQSRLHLVCRLLLEKKKKTKPTKLQTVSTTSNQVRAP